MTANSPESGTGVSQYTLATFSGFGQDSRQTALPLGKGNDNALEM